jgi:hypothetical protein
MELKNAAEHNFEEDIFASSSGTSIYLEKEKGVLVNSR